MGLHRPHPFDMSHLCFLSLIDPFIQLSTAFSLQLHNALVSLSTEYGALTFFGFDLRFKRSPVHPELQHKQVEEEGGGPDYVHFRRSGDRRYSRS